MDCLKNGCPVGFVLYYQFIVVLYLVVMLVREQTVPHLLMLRILFLPVNFCHLRRALP